MANSSKRYVIETLFTYGWDAGDEPEVYRSHKEAQNAIDEFIADGLAAFKRGHLHDFNPEDFRITEINSL